MAEQEEPEDDIEIEYDDDTDIGEDEDDSASDDDDKEESLTEKIERVGKVATAVARTSRKVMDAVTGKPKKRDELDFGDFDVPAKRRVPAPARQVVVVEKKRGFSPVIAAVLVTACFAVPLVYFLVDSKPAPSTPWITNPLPVIETNIFTLERITTNPRGDLKYIQLDVLIEFHNPRDYKILEQEKLKLQAAVIEVCHEMTQKQLLGSGAIDTLRKKLREKFYLIVGRNMIDEVYITNFVYRPSM